MQSLQDGQQGRGSISKGLGAQIEEVKIWQEKKREILGRIERINIQIQELEKQRQLLRKKVHPVYNKVELLDKGVKELEKRMST